MVSPHAAWQVIKRRGGDGKRRVCSPNDTHRSQDLLCQRCLRHHFCHPRSLTRLGTGHGADIQVIYQVHRNMVMSKKLMILLVWKSEELKKKKYEKKPLGCRLQVVVYPGVVVDPLLHPLLLRLLHCHRQQPICFQLHSRRGRRRCNNFNFSVGIGH